MLVIGIPGWCSPKGLEWHLSPIPGRVRECGHEFRLFRPHNYGLGGIDDMADELEAYIDQKTYGLNRDVVLLGHSMGGLLARYMETWLDRITGVITIATPHQGAPTARLAPFSLSAQQMLPGSNFLEHLASTAPSVPAFSINCYLDAIVPFKNSIWSDAREQRSVWYGHSGVLLSRKVANQVVDWLRLIG